MDVPHGHILGRLPGVFRHPVRLRHAGRGARAVPHHQLRTGVLPHTGLHDTLPLPEDAYAGGEALPVAARAQAAGHRLPAAALGPERVQPGVAVLLRALRHVHRGTLLRRGRTAGLLPGHLAADGAEQLLVPAVPHADERTPRVGAAATGRVRSGDSRHVRAGRPTWACWPASR